MTQAPRLRWQENGVEQDALWRSEVGVAPPRRVRLADDTLTADAAYRLACEGWGLLWRGDFQNARQLLQALARRVDRKPRQTADAAQARPAAPASLADPAVDAEAAVDRSAVAPAVLAQAFHLHRQAQGQRARVLGSLLIPMDPDRGIPLRRAPDLRPACAEAWGPPEDQASVVALRELMGLVGAHEWRKKGVAIAALGPPPDNRIHPHYGVFSPVRGEYLDLVAQAPLPSIELAFDIGTGTGVIAAVLARRGVRRIVATENDPRALACARDNVARLALGDRIDVVEADLFPPGRSPLVVCNPPWLPARPSSPVERAVYDPDSAMLRGFLAGVGSHLAPGGQTWLILSDFAEHLGLRTRTQLLDLIAASGLQVLGRVDITPRHPKALDVSAPLHGARMLEVTSLWRLAAR